MWKAFKKLSGQLMRNKWYTFSGLLSRFRAADFKNEILELNEFLDYALLSFLPFDPKGGQVRFILNTDKMFVSFPPKEFYQTICNLFSNVFLVIDDSSSTLQLSKNILVETGRMVVPTKQVWVEISEDGPSLPKECKNPPNNLITSIPNDSSEFDFTSAKRMVENRGGKLCIEPPRPGTGIRIRILFPEVQLKEAAIHNA